jgi:hypothetical protein
MAILIAGLTILAWHLYFNQIKVNSEFTFEDTLYYGFITNSGIILASGVLLVILITMNYIYKRVNASGNKDTKILSLVITLVILFTGTTIAAWFLIYHQLRIGDLTTLTDPLYFNHFISLSGIVLASGILLVTVILLAYIFNHF